MGLTRSASPGAPGKAVVTIRAQCCGTMTPSVERETTPWLQAKEGIRSWQGRHHHLPFVRGREELLIEFDVDKEGLTKSGVNGLIDALKKVRAAR